MLLPAGVPEGAAQLPEGIPDGVRGPLHIGLLPIVLQQRQGACQPPQGHQQEGDNHSRACGNADFVPQQHQHQAENEGNYGADVAKGVALGGHIVHALLGGDLRQHGVIEHQTGGIAYLRQHIDDQEGQPAPGRAQGGAAHNAQQHHGQKQLFLKAILVCQRAADGGDKGNHQGGYGTGVAPESQILALIQAACLCQGVEVNGNQSGNQQDKGGVSHIVEDPVPFQSREFELLHWYILSHPKVGANSGPRGAPLWSASASWAARTG